MNLDAHDWLCGIHPGLTFNLSACTPKRSDMRTVGRRVTVIDRSRFSVTGLSGTVIDVVDADDGENWVVSLDLKIRVNMDEVIERIQAPRGCFWDIAMG